LNALYAASNHAADLHKVAEDRAEGSRERPLRWSIRYEDLPGAVKQTVGQQLEQRDTIVAATEVQHADGKITYVVHVTSPHERARNLYLDESGNLLATKDVAKAAHRYVKIGDLPGPVQNTLRHEAANQGFKRIAQITDEGQTWYVAELNNGRVLRVDSSGNLVQRPKTLAEREAWNEGGIERQVVPVNTLPGAVQGTINNARGQDKVIQVVKITRGNDVNYRVRIEGPNNRIRMLQIDDNGKLIAEWNATEPGRVEVKLDTLPGPVQGAISHEANGDRIVQITQVTRDNVTWYVAEIQDRNGHLRVLRVDSNGHVIQPESPNR
jgi:6-phosphogluconolactonase (cycloisomerase 2 family)